MSLVLIIGNHTTPHTDNNSPMDKHTGPIMVTLTYPAKYSAASAIPTENMIPPITMMAIALA